ncbi:hypothetical protein H7F15_17155 [Pontibacter sp. Tf4]|uniref:hypothetical protein n=1 Tax=Pontibacter sp. Tf4 TaxID=2761620 RepID=UPI00162A31E4|nr:hypothetical protein [Pontibacter sp. Tf4]MBB6612773.1 hypothetical protein [Pontibacter sp. Tf4]
MKKEHNSNLKFYVIVGILSLVFMILVRYFFPYMVKSSLCDKEQELKDAHLNGVVKQKYIDKPNHAAEVLLVHHLNGSEYKLYLDGDSSSLYNYATVGDSIYKELESTKVEVYREGNAKAFMVAFGCEEFTTF